MKHSILVGALCAAISMPTLAEFVYRTPAGMHVTTAPKALFDFTSHTFTNCGMDRYWGPNIYNCLAHYTADWVTDTNNFNVLSEIQKWTVPIDGRYLIEVKGGQGGSNENGDGGHGAKLSAEFDLVKGEVVSLVVGHAGQSQYTTNGISVGGGGGGSFVFMDRSTPLIIAGGGGGAGAGGGSYGYNDFRSKGLDADPTNELGTYFGGVFNSGQPYPNYCDGTSLGQGGEGTTSTGGGGAGWLSNGQGFYPGLSSSFRGGRGASVSSYYSLEAGFGGGGAGRADDNAGAGGGGGYTGGNAGCVGDAYLPGRAAPGGAGGSKSWGENTQFLGNGAGHGYIKITKMS
ncbi:glycine-rich protein [Neptuniibacter sp. QD37_11]|uniref:glycine-rich protein n=1 Tax=Neptuniibacter sp. QD37_11 TaxID=3398209 RepID=UPI0039F4DCE3